MVLSEPVIEDICAGVMTPAAESLTTGKFTYCRLTFSPARTESVSLTLLASAVGLTLMAVTAPDDEVFTSLTFSMMSLSI